MLLRHLFPPLPLDESEALFQYLGMEELESSQVKDSGQQDAGQQQQEEGTDGQGDPIGEGHDGGGQQAEGQQIAQHVEQAQAYEAMGKPMPRQEPKDGEQGVNGHHHHDAIMSRQQY